MWSAPGWACGVEYFAHPWEFGPRKTKELMLTGDALTVDEAYQLGMVSKVFPEAELTERTLEFARRIAEVPTMAALLAKEAVNQSVDNMGFYNALNACFTLHQLNHSHWAQVHENGFPVGLEEDGLPNWRTARRSWPRSKTRSAPTADRRLPAVPAESVKKACRVSAPLRPGQERVSPRAGGSTGLSAHHMAVTIASRRRRAKVPVPGRIWVSAMTLGFLIFSVFNAFLL